MLGGVLASSHGRYLATTAPCSALATSAISCCAFVENLMPGLAGEAWACSTRDFDWPAAGFDGAKLGNLLTQIGRLNSRLPHDGWRVEDRRDADDGQCEIAGACARLLGRCGKIS